MREWPVPADLLDPVMADFRPRRVTRVAFRARSGAGPDSNLDPPVDDFTPARKLAPEPRYAPRETCRMQAAMDPRHAAAFRRLGHTVGTLPRKPS